MGQKSSCQQGGIRVQQTCAESCRPTQVSQTPRGTIADISTLALTNEPQTLSCKDKPLLSPYFRELVLECFSKSNGEVASRILQRACQHREDVKLFFTSAGIEVKTQVKEVLQNYLEEVIGNLDDTDMVRKLSRDYGRAHVTLRLVGFKPDFFAALADAITTECVFLGGDMITQTPTNTFKAWTLLVGMMFSSVRDGYYHELRRQRKQTPDSGIDRSQTQTPVTPLGRIRGNENSLSVESNSSSANNEESQNGERSISRSFSPSPQCSAPVSLQNESPDKSNGGSHRKGSASSLLSVGTSFLRSSTPRCVTPRGSASSKAQEARKAYSARSQTAITPAPSCEILSENSKGFYRTTHHSHDLSPMQPKHLPLSGRFQKNVSLDETKKKRLEDMSKKHATLCRKKSSSASSVFDPNSVIHRFMNDQL